jgi:hypothetical protein
VDTFAKRPGFAGLFSFLGVFLKHHFGSLRRNHMPRLWPRPPRPCRFASAAVMEKDARTLFQKGEDAPDRLVRVSFREVSPREKQCRH